MLTRVRSNVDEGFTLVELLIAMLIMGIAVAALVTAMGGLVSATDSHRGLAQDEAVAHNVAQQVVSKYSFSTELDAAAPASQSYVCIKDDPDGFLTSALTSIDLTVDQETMAVTGSGVKGGVGCAGSSWKIPVTRGFGGTSNVDHVAKAPVHQLFACPGTTANGSGIGYVMATGTRAYVLPNPGISVTAGIEYWDPTSNTFSSGQDACFTTYQARCHDEDNTPSKFDLLPECDTGLARVTLTVTDTNKSDGASNTDCASGAVCTTTQVLLRRGTQ